MMRKALFISTLRLIGNITLIFIFLIGISCREKSNKSVIKMDISNKIYLKKSMTYGNILKSIKIYYKDSVTDKKSIQYRELENIGDNTYFSKPTKIDVVVGIVDGYFEGIIDISIEELLVPKFSFNDSIYGNLKIIDSTWCLHKTIYNVNFTNNMSEKLKTNSIKIKDVNYKTAYYLDSAVYDKIGFRIVAFYRSNTNKKIEIVKKEFYYRGC